MEKFERSKWHSSLINRKIPDYCTGLQNPAEPWYSFTSGFQKKECPYDAGHVEIFDGLAVATVPDYFPPTFIGKFRISFYSFHIDDDNSEVTDCMRVGFEIINS